MKVQLPKTEAFTQFSNPFSVQLLKKCTITILNQNYCPGLSPYLVGKIQKRKIESVETCMLDHIKAQMVKADFIKTSSNAS